MKRDRDSSYDSSSSSGSGKGKKPLKLMSKLYMDNSDGEKPEDTESEVLHRKVQVSGEHSSNPRSTSPNLPPNATSQTSRDSPRGASSSSGTRAVGVRKTSFGKITQKKTKETNFMLSMKELLRPILKGVWQLLLLLIIKPIFWVILKPIFFLFSHVMQAYLRKFNNKSMINRKETDKNFGVIQRLKTNRNRKKPYSLLLGLDETLVYCSETKIPNYDKIISVHLLGQKMKKFYVKMRPNLQKFFQEVTSILAWRNWRGIGSCIGQ